MKHPILMSLVTLAACAPANDRATSTPMEDWLAQLSPSQQAELTATMSAIDVVSDPVSVVAARAAQRRFEDQLVHAIGADLALAYPGLSERESTNLERRLEEVAAVSGRLIDEDPFAVDLRDAHGDEPPPPYAHTLLKRTHYDITWCLEQRTTDVTRSEQNAEIQAAMDEWSLYTPMVFERDLCTRSPDLRIGFYEGAHGDWASFDGKGHAESGAWENTLAHASVPGWLWSRVDFDDYEDWDTAAADVQTVAVHEVGHWLGLDHSDVSTAVMDEDYHFGRTELTGDDIDGIQALYPPDACDTLVPLSARIQDDAGGALLFAAFAVVADSKASAAKDAYYDASKTADDLQEESREAAIDGEGTTAAATADSTASDLLSELSTAGTTASGARVNSAARAFLDTAESYRRQAVANAKVLRTYSTSCK